MYIRFSISFGLRVVLLSFAGSQLAVKALSIATKFEKRSTNCMTWHLEQLLMSAGNDDNDLGLSADNDDNVDVC